MGVWSSGGGEVKWSFVDSKKRRLTHPYPANPPPQQQQLYQPFRPPPSPLPPKFRSLDIPGRLEVLANRLGLWFEYAPLIPSLYREGFTPPSIEEITGVSGVEQNRLIVGSQVRDSLVQSNTDEELMSFFDTGGAELLYEIRLLSASQRAEAVRYIVENRLDAKGAQDLARAIKDFPRRQMDKGWSRFDYGLPGDCLSFMYYRQSREHRNPSEERTAALNQALELAVSESARNEVLRELEGGKDETEEKGDDLGAPVRVPVVTMHSGEVAEASSVVFLPVCKAEEGVELILEAPFECRSGGDFGVVEAEKEWKRWVVLPGWEPLARLKEGGIAVVFNDASVIPWKANRWYMEEAIIVVTDRSRKEVELDGAFYLAMVDGALKVDRESELKEMGVKECIGTVILVVRPPKYGTSDQLSDEDWE
ncbi:Rubisco accumulation factor 2 [Hibiscus syriacus]|uniref:Rubisco accumulation factor 2 n=1 Tax=Hibiscus syriacus TaxID=106335 RepID=A0A6A2YZI9_HIBSY|nr:Rubisco accumulation factor 2 [Hibiscus syriacus]